MTDSAYEPPPGYLLVPAVRPVRPRRLGVVAFVIALALLVTTIVVSIVIGIGAIPFTVHDVGGFHYNLDFGTGNATETQLAVASTLQIALGSVLGILALVLGIVAIAQRRGRAFGIVAVVLAALGPFLTGGVTLATVAVNLR